MFQRKPPGTGSPDAPGGFRWNIRALRAHLTDFRPDLLQLEEEPWHPMAPRVIAEAVRLSIPVVLFSQDLDRPRGLWARRRERACYRAARAGIGGHALAARLLQDRLPGKPVLELPQRGVALPPVEERPVLETLTIGYVGRLLPDRGVDRLLRACATLLGPW
jgi:glycosyltransferase involved in cell wall biosynthesis